MTDPLASYRDTMRRRGVQARREQEQRRRRGRGGSVSGRSGSPRTVSCVAPGRGSAGGPRRM